MQYTPSTARGSFCYTVHMIDWIFYKVLGTPYKLKVRHIHKKVGAPLVVFLHGIGNSGLVWSDIIKGLPKDVSYVSLDLLGFGSSKKPNYVDYNLNIHAKSVMRTVKNLNFSPSSIILVGHSLGSLVSIEVAKKYPSKITNLLLCSPPFYLPSTNRKIPSGDDILKKIYEYVQKDPENFVEISAIAKKYHIVTDDFELNKENVDSYMATLNSSIVHQRSLQDAIDLPKHIEIYVIRGAFDPLVLPKNLKMLKKMRPSTKITTIVATHDINKRYDKQIKKDLDEILKSRR